MKNVLPHAAVLILCLSAVFAASAQNLRIGLQEDPDKLDPAQARTYVSRLVFQSLCDKLVDLDERLEFVPRLATSWSWSADHKVLTFTLRKGVVFQDGTPFDAAAAKANLDRDLTLKTSSRKAELETVEKVDAPNPDTLVLTLKHPDATLLAALSDRAGMMISPATFQSSDVNAVALHPVCSGPYKFVSRVQDSSIVLEKFKDYWDAKDYHFDRVSFIPIPDSTVRLQNLMAGDLDLIERVNPSDLNAVKQNANLKLYPSSGLGFELLQFNEDNGPEAKTNPFANPLVRQALNLVIDRNAINQAIGYGYFDPAGQLLPPSSPYADAKLFAPPVANIEKAKALLQQAGTPQVTAHFMFGNDTTSTAVAQMIQAMASQAGINLVLQPTEYAALNGLMHSGRFEVAMRAWSGRPDPDGNIYQYVACNGGWNDGKYCNQKVDALLNQARTIPDLAQRKALYDQAQQLETADMGVVPLYFPPWLFAGKAALHGFKAYPDGMIRLGGVTLSSK